ncbi:MAG TPA: beta-propeller domain-containing protein, partial [Myxococcaceae bacterium]|nr:beta-propeller domain-containing protein [Myxococcaceae bacterium]
MGSTLYVLNQYRGLQIIDVGNSAAPRLLASVPIVAGRPEGLYVHLDGLAIVVVSDYFNYRILPLDGAPASPWRGSRVVVLNVSQSSSPSVLATLEIEGDVTDSRIVGNILYVFSQRSAWYRNPASPDTRDLGIVASFDLSNPRALAPVDKLEFPASGWTLHANITEDRVILSQFAWDVTGPMTRFQAIDISDPRGTLRLGASFSSQGMVQNRWSMNYANGIFKAALQLSFNAGARLQIWSMATPSSVEPLGSLDVHVPEALTAAGFDPRYAYL